jgi:hypothetical protein
MFINDLQHARWRTGRLRCSVAHGQCSMLR